MAKKATIKTISSGYASNTQLNFNFAALNTKFDNTLSLDGSTPNSMGADLDMNGNDILNTGNFDVDTLTVDGATIGAAITAAAGNITTIFWEGAYAGGTAYTVNDGVSYNGSSYVCILNSTGNLPTNATYWEVFAAAGTDGEDGDGSGDMLVATYDPTAVAGDAFAMDSMAEGTTTKILTNTERTKLSGIETAADVTDETNVKAALDGATITGVTKADGDKVLIQDIDDSDSLKYVLASEFGADGAVLYSSQTLTDAQKIQARSNIGSSAVPDAVIEDQKASGTDGGTFTSGAWQTRVLNTEVRDPDGLVSISSNQFTPTVAGWVEWTCPAFQTASHSTRLYNVTDSAVVGTGSSGSAYNANNGSSSFGGAAVIAEKAYRVEHYCTGTKTTNGFGDGHSLGTNVYTRLKFWRA